ncbi:MAG: hypothetical protein K9G59_18755, partial [Caulobacter sp.]|nr:hypothetical protein [Caulobacter sp.]
TRGALCYLLETLMREAQRPGGGLDESLVDPVVRLWMATQDLMGELGTDRAGLPLPPAAPAEPGPRRRTFLGRWLRRGA